MSPRSIRRAAERRAEKEARKALRHTPAEPHSFSEELDWTPEPTLTPCPFATGPRTPEGKRISSMNAGDEAAILSLPKIQAMTGLTGRTVLLPSDDADAYRALVDSYQRAYRPVGLRESELVQSMADTQWRLQRIPALESALYAKGRIEFAENHAEEEITMRKALIDLDTHLKYEKQLRNLQLQESRLHRRYEKESAELRQLQKDRKAETETEPRTFVTEPRASASGTQFVFSNAENDQPTSPAEPTETPYEVFHEAA